MSLAPMRWTDGGLELLDQRLLPSEERWLLLRSWGEVRDAIRDMAVRGAPAIGIAAAYGLALAAKSGADAAEAAAGLAASRPTAVNLQWAIDRVMRLPIRDAHAVLAEARAIEAEDLACNRAIGEHGAALVPQNATVLTICNTGALATGGHGTALGIIRTAYQQGRLNHVYACETRPRMQGLKLTAWEMLRDGIPFHAIADGGAASLMGASRIDLVIVGADRIAANGDTANKLGTLGLAVLAHHFGVPFVVAAPTSTLDLSMGDGSAIPIEERSADELTTIDGIRIAPEGCPVFNPAFDVTPGDLITTIVTERGVCRPPYEETLPRPATVSG